VFNKDQHGSVRIHVTCCDLRDPMGYLLVILTWRKTEMLAGLNTLLDGWVS
jgi:hypothetical protein